MARVLITGKANYTGSRSAKALAVAPESLFNDCSDATRIVSAPSPVCVPASNWRLAGYLHPGREVDHLVALGNRREIYDERKAL